MTGPPFRTIFSGSGRRNTLLAALFYVFAAIGMAGYAAMSEPAQTALEKANRYAQAGDHMAARVEYLNALKAGSGADFDLGEAYVKQAQNYIALNDGAAASAALQRSIGQGTDPDAVRPAMAESLGLQGDNKGALEWLETGKLMRTDIGYAERIRGRIHLALGNMADAGVAFDNAIAADPGNSMLWTDVARFRLAGGEQGGAIEAAELALRLDPRNVAAILLRGRLVRSQYGLSAALPWFARALELSPDDMGVLTDYAATLGDMGHMTEMLAMTRRILSLDPQNARAFQMQAVLAARAGQFDLARTLMQKSGGDENEQPFTLLVDGIIDFQSGNYNNAIDRFQRLVKMQPDNRNAQLLLARAMYGNGEYADLIERFSTLADREDAEPYLLTLLGRSYEAENDRAQAAAYLNRAASPYMRPVPVFGASDSADTIEALVARDPGNTKLRVEYIRAQLESGNNDVAVYEAQALNRQNPTVTQAHLLLGNVYAASGILEKALAQFDIASRADFSEGVMLRMVAVLREQGRDGNATALLFRYLAYNPGNMTAARMLARADIVAGNWGRAVRLLETVKARLGASDAMMMSDLAYAQIMAGDAAAGRRNAHIAYFIQPANPAVAHVYGLALYETGEILPSVELMEQAYRMAPQNAYLGYNLGRAYAAVGRKSDADTGSARCPVQRRFPCP